jgi:hypothetical protein
LAQPDEDDYGYVSQEASAFYNKLMEKYTSTPSEEPKTSKKSLLKSSAADLNNTKVCLESAVCPQSPLGVFKKLWRTNKLSWPHAVCGMWIL